LVITRHVAAVPLLRNGFRAGVPGAQIRFLKVVASTIAAQLPNTSTSVLPALYANGAYDCRIDTVERPVCPRRDAIA
jgi:hypothetical protein